MSVVGSTSIVSFYPELYSSYDVKSYLMLIAIRPSYGHDKLICPLRPFRKEKDNAGIKFPLHP